MNERRRFERLAIKIPVKWKMGGRHKKTTAPGFLLTTHNITKAGLFLGTSSPIPKKGDRVELGITLPGTRSPLWIKGIVVWRARKQSSAHFYPGVGIRFTRLDKKKSAILHRFIENKIRNFRDARELKHMYLTLKDMASRLVELEERHASATHFKKVITNAVNDIDEVAHILDREINEIKHM